MSNDHIETPNLPPGQASTDGERAGDGIRFPAIGAGLESVQVWEYDAGTGRTSRDVARDTIQALTAPDDFPPIEAAIVAGDRVALAVDPNVPNLDQVIEGAIRAIRGTPAAGIEIVVWEEATPETLARIEAAADGRGDPSSMRCA
jgi:hypothetical protein